jgi:hypothetical protein
VIDFLQIRQFIGLMKIENNDDDVNNMNIENGERSSNNFRNADTTNGKPTISSILIRLLNQVHVNLFTTSKNEKNSTYHSVDNCSHKTDDIQMIDRKSTSLQSSPSSLPSSSSSSSSIYKSSGSSIKEAIDITTSNRKFTMHYIYDADGEYIDDEDDSGDKKQQLSLITNNNEKGKDVDDDNDDLIQFDISVKDNVIVEDKAGNVDVIVAEVASEGIFIYNDEILSEIINFECNEVQVIGDEMSETVNANTETIDTQTFNVETETIDTHSVNANTETIDTQTVYAYTETIDTQTFNVETETSHTQTVNANTETIDTQTVYANTETIDTQTFNVETETSHTQTVNAFTESIDTQTIQANTETIDTQTVNTFTETSDTQTEIVIKENTNTQTNLVITETIDTQTDDVIYEDNNTQTINEPVLISTTNTINTNITANTKVTADGNINKSSRSSDTAVVQNASVSYQQTQSTTHLYLTDPKATATSTTPLSFDSVESQSDIYPSDETTLVENSSLTVQVLSTCPSSSVVDEEPAQFVVPVVVSVEPVTTEIPIDVFIDSPSSLESSDFEMVERISEASIAVVNNNNNNNSSNNDNNNINNVTKSPTSSTEKVLSILSSTLLSTSLNNLHHDHQHKLKKHISFDDSVIENKISGMVVSIAYSTKYLKIFI